MLKALGDRYSRYLTPADYTSFREGISGRYSGVGVWLRADDAGTVLVGSVQAGVARCRGGRPHG